MKIIYTKDFKKRLNQPYRQIELVYYKLKSGDNTSLESFKDITSSSFLSKTSPTSLREYYSCEAVKYSNGIQIFLEIPESDASLYSKEFVYQSILFFYKDTTYKDEDPVISLAFVIFNDYSINEEGIISFSGLELTTSRNIITIPNLEWKCNLIFNSDSIVSFLENKYGQGLINTLNYNKSEDSCFISDESLRSMFYDIFSEEQDQSYLETTFVNKFGIKIY